MQQPLYALHGFLGTPTDWHTLFQGHFLQDRLMSIDLFSQPIVPFDLWAQQFNQQIPATHKPILMGYSLGGRLALHALMQQPNRWAGAVIISAHAGLSSQAEREKRLRLDQAWAKRFEQEEWDSLMHSWNAQEVFSQKRRTFSRVEKDYVRSVLSKALCHWSLGNQQALTSKLALLDLPILWICGENDSIYFGQAQKLNLKHPHSKKWIAPQAGHRVPWELPQEFLYELSNFLKQLEGLPL